MREQHQKLVERAGQRRFLNGFPACASQLPSLFKAMLAALRFPRSDDCAKHKRRCDNGVAARRYCERATCKRKTEVAVAAARATLSLLVGAGMLAHSPLANAADESPAKDMSMRMNMPSGGGGMQMPEHGALGIPMTRAGSGTAWQPDSTPMEAIHGELDGWRLMFHENVFVGYDAQGGPRGDRQFFSTNWLMAMAEHDLGPGQFSARAMLSLEPWTVGGQGYPLLLQTGETWQGAPLHDHQHPHDLFMEAALLYELPVSNAFGLQIYVAPVGEPALGPVAYPHRASARSNPLGTLGHHWQDSTHISFGVLTVGIFTRQLKLEASWFNGREPDETRYDLDLRTPDSVATRLSFNPTADISAQVSWGYLKSPEAQQPDTSLHRVTASLAWNRHMFSQGNWGSAAVSGFNFVRGEKPTQSTLLETNLDFDLHHTLFGRAELATKTGKDLVLPTGRAESTYQVVAFSAGYVFALGSVANFVPGIGVQGSLNVVGGELGAFYGSRTPLGGVVFAQIRPDATKM